MATDGPDPAPCAPDIFENGEPVFMTHSIPSNAMERWVRLVADDCKLPVDWHFSGGRAVVLTTGDLATVRAAIEKRLPEHDAAYRAAVKSLLGDDVKPPRYFFGVDA